jgi:microsomal epoxide hydrolase
MPVKIEPFRVDIPEADLADLHDRLARTRFPEQIPGAEWYYGTELGYLRDFVGYWHDTYDWRKTEARLNELEHFTCEIDGTRVHFVHARSPEPGAFPLVITHGWPGSFVEFEAIIPLLTDPAAHGGDPMDAFHVVCPSIPGYAFSGPTADRGWDTRRVARAWAELMAGLDYDRYGAQGGDWGAMISTNLALVDPGHCVGLHLNMPIGGPPPGSDLSNPTPEEADALASMTTYADVDSGYMKIQSTKPQTIGYALDDSPAGLAAWIVEKFRTWSDCGGDVERAFTRDQLIDNLMMYWLTATAHSSARMYYETTKSGNFGTRGERVETPTGCARFPGEIIRPPRSWVEQSYNVVHWTAMPRGGHFAAMEQPELLATDVREFFRGIR